jgi:NitT/TauT family transport system permease protein
MVLLPGIAIWELLGRLKVTFIIPPFTDVVVAGLSVWTSDRFLAALGGSISALLVGFAMAALSGLVLGVLMGRFAVIEWIFDPYINVLMSAPKAALIPVIVLFFGFGRTAVILTVFMYAFFPVVVNTAAGVRQAPRNLVEMARSFQASEWQLARRVTIPAAAPLILGGLRFAAARSIKGLVIGEQLIAVVGIGALVQRYGIQFQFDYLYALILLIAIAGLSVSGLLQWVEGALMPWVPRTAAASRPTTRVAGGTAE